MTTEQQFELLLVQAGILFTRPERDQHDPTTLDFHIPAAGGLYIEAKDYHTPRIANQLAKLPQDASAMVLVGRDSVAALLELVRLLLPTFEGDYVDVARQLLAVVKLVDPKDRQGLARAFLMAGLLATLAEGAEPREAAARAGTMIDELAADVAALGR